MPTNYHTLFFFKVSPISLLTVTIGVNCTVSVAGLALIPLPFSSPSLPEVGPFGDVEEEEVVRRRKEQ